VQGLLGLPRLSVPAMQEAREEEMSGWHIALLILGYLVAGFIVTLVRMILRLGNEWGDYSLDFILFIIWPICVLAAVVIAPVALARMIADRVQGKDGPEC
jgi:hypothetical protein